MSDFGDPHVITNPIISIINTPRDLLIAQRLHAYRYLLEGYVKEEDISPEGTLVDSIDPYKNRSTYFTVADETTPNRPVVVARQIGFHDSESFPALTHLMLFPEARSQIDSIDLSECVEISGLAKLPGAPGILSLLVYRGMWHHSLSFGHNKWFITSDNTLTPHLQAMFGGALQRIGKPQFYLGSLSDPMMLDSRHGLTTLLRECLSESDEAPGISKRDIVAVLIDELDRGVLPVEQQELIRKIFAI